jgi:hypothetical protein
MPQKSHIVAAAAFALVVADDIRTKIRIHKDADLFAEALTLTEQITHRQDTQIDYLMHLLNENGVEATEFDLIALNSF